MPRTCDASPAFEIMHTIAAASAQAHAIVAGAPSAPGHMVTYNFICKYSELVYVLLWHRVLACTFHKKRLLNLHQFSVSSLECNDCFARVVPARIRSGKDQGSAGPGPLGG